MRSSPWWQPMSNSAGATVSAGAPVLVVRHRRIMLATARRVLSQLRHDPRTIALLLVAPIMLIGLLAWVLSGQPGAFDDWGALLLGIFPLLVMFLVTSVATLRERTGGTLERLMTTPMSKVDFLGGYGLAFGAVAIVQAVLASAFTFGLFGLSIAAAVWAVVFVAVLDALVGTSLGLFVSAFARTEFQAVQFLPALLLPQLLLCGIVAPTSSLPQPLEAISYLLPLTYAVNAMQQLTHHASITGEVWRDVLVLCGFIVALVAGGAATLRRRTE
jgi:ABC-2 type transport system permease protein